MNLIDQRCANHALREAAVQCPSCKRYFCRECVTEHQGRMMCVSCVTVLSRGDSKIARTAATIWSITAIAGILVAWLVFYYLGQTLGKIPSEFHGATIRPLENHVGRAILPAAAFQAACRESAEKVANADRSHWSRFYFASELRPARAVFHELGALS